MKIFNIKLFAFIVFMSMGTGAFAYTWGFSNHTKKTLVIGFGLQGADFWNFNIVKPGKRVVFSYYPPNGWAGFCMSGAEWIEYEPNMVIPGVTQNGGLDMYQPGAAMLPDGFRKTPVYDRYYPKRKYIDLVFVPDDVYAATVKAAATFGGGFDKLLCTAVAAIKIVNKGQCPSMFSALIEWIGGLISRSTCRDREIAIYPDSQGNPLFTTILN